MTLLIALLCVVVGVDFLQPAEFARSPIDTSLRAAFFWAVSSNILLLGSISSSLSSVSSHLDDIPYNMGKPSKARGRGGTFLGGRNAAPAGASGRAKGLRNGANNRREQVDEHIPASLVTDSEEEEDSASESASEEGSGSEEASDEEEAGSDDEEEGDDDDDGDDDVEDLDNVKIAVPVAMWVSSLI
jgi:hypothetical protein